MATPPDFTTGAVLTAAQMNAVGLWRITTCTVTSTGGTAATASDGVITIGNGNTLITIDNAFSADFKAYKIILSSGALSGTADIGFRFGTAATNYAFSFLYSNYTNTPLAVGTTTGTSFSIAGGGSTDAIHSSIEVINPFETKYGLFFSNMSSGSGAGYTTGQHRTATSYTSFSMLPSAGSFSSGNIRVYGYND
jgi:hypothetical protein